MAARRDWKAVYARRNARAIARGHKSYNDERRKIETGKIAPVAPKLVRSPKTKQAQQKRQPGLFGLTLLERKNAANEIWVGTHGPTVNDDDPRRKIVQYDPNMRDKKYTEDEYVEAYYDAFASGNYDDTRHDGGSDPLRFYFVDMLDDGYSIDEYDDHYTSI